MSDAVDALEDAVDHIDGLAAEVKRLQVSNDELRTSRRRGRMMLGALGVIVIALCAVVWLTLRGFGNAREDACQNRNASAEITREFAETQFRIFEAATFNQNPTDRQLALLAQLRRAVPQQSETEFDCNGDDTLDRDDYP